MFGLGMMEILMILAIALIVVGPQKLPELAKTLGRAMGEFKRSAQDLKRSMDIESTVQDIDTPQTDLKEILKDKTSASTPSPHEEAGTDEAETENADSDAETPDSTDDSSDVSDSPNSDPTNSKNPA